AGNGGEEGCTGRGVQAPDGRRKAPMRSAEQATVSRSADAIHVEQQLEQQAETILFSQGSLYAVIGMLTLAVLFCAGVLAYSVRRNDLLKTEYRRVMEAIAMRRSKTTSFPTEPEPTETPETMGPAPKLDEATQDAILLLLTRKPISNIQRPNANKPRTAKRPPASSTLLYDDLDSGVKRLPEVTLSLRSDRQTTTTAQNETTTSLSTSERTSATSTFGANDDANNDRECVGRDRASRTRNVPEGHICDDGERRSGACVRGCVDVEFLGLRSQQHMLPVIALFEWLMLLTLEARAVLGICHMEFDSLASKSGNFSSPQYPEPYPASIHCYYLFKGQESETLKITFLHFDLEPPCLNDFVDISTISVTNVRQLVGRYCGVEVPVPLLTMKPRMEIIFKTNHAHERTGFYGMYQFTDESKGYSLERVSFLEHVRHLLDEAFRDSG
ncbi:hypothetical protein MTO96_050553, partial [Rhipicephalus appendiculatus]